MKELKEKPEQGVEMTTDELEMYGLSLFGTAWQVQLAREFDIDRRNIQNWIKRESVPEFVDKEIRDVLYQRLSEIKKAVEYYEERHNS